MQHNDTSVRDDNNAAARGGDARKGFASMDKQRLKEVSSKGGQAPRTKKEDARNRRIAKREPGELF
jgi:general stress protein YciG